MIKKSYTNFAVTDDALQIKTEQEPCKTNATAIEAMRAKQCTPFKETFPVHVHHSIVDNSMSFNEWAIHIHKLVTDKHYHGNIIHTV